MKTISIEPDVIESLDDGAALAGVGSEFIVRPSSPARKSAAARRQSLAELWDLPAIEQPAQKETTAAQPLWLPLNQESLGEKIMLGLLVAASAIAIGYGLLSLVDMAPNWAGFIAWGEQVIH